MKKRLLIIGTVWPEPKSSAAGSRLMQLIDVFIKGGYNLHFVSACAKTDNAYDLSKLGIEQSEIELNNSSFDDFIKQLDPNIVLFDRFMTEEQYGWRVAESCPKAIRVLDTEDLHFLRKGREDALNAKQDFKTEYLLNDLAKREIASIYRCDLSLIISEYEMKLLIEEFKISEDLLMYVPFLVNGTFQNRPPSLNDRCHFVTIGNFLHKPNVDALHYLKHEIWTLIRSKLSNEELYVFGAYANENHLSLTDESQGFFVKGYVHDVNTMMQQARVCIAPLRFGAGLKGKLIDAMINGTPCIMTSIAAEGMFGNLEPNGYVEDDPEKMAKKAVELYINEVDWKDKQSKGLEILQKRFDSTYFTSKVIETLDLLSNNLEKRRQSNFIGQMLQYHTMRSTKFMSKWIEEKQKKS